MLALLLIAALAQAPSVLTGGPVVAGGIVNAGHGALGGRPGNVLLAFDVDAAGVGDAAPAGDAHGWTASGASRR